MIWQFPTYKINQAPEWDLLESEFEWFRDMQDVEQDPIWHGEGDVFVHTKMVVNELTSLPEFQMLSEQDKHILFAAAMFHDIEKRSTTTTENIDGVNRIVSPRHAKKGELTTRRILYKDIVTPFNVREQIAKLVRLHGLPLWAIEKSDPRKEVINASLSVNTEHLSMLAKADMLGRICKDKDELILKIELFNELCRENGCFGKPKSFKSNYGRYLFLNKPDIAPDYEPFDDLKFDVFVMCALPGSGKDTYIKKHFKLPILSLDDIRREHKFDPTNKKENGQVIQMGKEKAKEFMRKKESFVFNATNVTVDLRRRWISLFAEYGGRVHLVYLEVPFKNLMAQNSNREHQVPEKVINKLINTLEVPTFMEAHEVSHVVEDLVE